MTSPAQEQSSQRTVTEQEPVPKPKTLWRFCKVLIWRATQVFAGVCAIYTIFCILGLWPVNREFQNSPDGVEVFVSSSEIHADFIVPIRNSVVDWTEVFPPDDFPTASNYATHMAIGWGDRGFYLNTPSWSDLSVSTAGYAMLLPSETVIHVQCMGPPKENDNCRRVVLSAEQYTRLVDFIRRSLAGGKSEQIAGYHYNQFDAFYTSDGSYHAFNTCNSWVGQGLAASGVCTGQWTPLPGTVLYYLPDP